MRQNWIEAKTRLETGEAAMHAAAAAADPDDPDRHKVPRVESRERSREPRRRGAPAGAASAGPHQGSSLLLDGGEMARQPPEPAAWVHVAEVGGGGPRPSRFRVSGASPRLQPCLVVPISKGPAHSRRGKRNSENSEEQRLTARSRRGGERGRGAAAVVPQGGAPPPPTWPP
jgi:hypothetical protein